MSDERQQSVQRMGAWVLPHPNATLTCVSSNFSNDGPIKVRGRTTNEDRSSPYHALIYPLTMARDDNISLHESVPPSVGEPDLHDSEHDVSNDEDVEPRQRDSKRTRTLVLLGSAILQLPIWGELTNRRS